LLIRQECSIPPPILWMNSLKSRKSHLNLRFFGVFPLMKIMQPILPPSSQLSSVMIFLPSKKPKPDSSLLLRWESSWLESISIVEVDLTGQPRSRKPSVWPGLVLKLAGNMDIPWKLWTSEEDSLKVNFKTIS